MFIVQICLPRFKQYIVFIVRKHTKMHYHYPTVDSKKVFNTLLRNDFIPLSP